MGIDFSFFFSKTYVVGTRPMYNHNLCFEQKYEKNHIFIEKIIVFTAVKNHCILHRHVCVMLNSMTQLKYFGKFP